MRVLVGHCKNFADLRFQLYRILTLSVIQDYDYSFSVAAPSVTSNYSTLGRSREPDYDYSTLAKSEVPVSEEELEK